MDRTPRKQSVILALTQNTSMMQREIGTKFSVRVATVHELFISTKRLIPLHQGKGGGQKKKTSTDDRFFLRKSKTNPRLTAVEVARVLRDRRVNLHASNV